VEKLKADLETLIDELQNSAEFRGRLENLMSVYPFNEYEYIISTLLGEGILPALQKPTRKLDPDYSGQYDFSLEANGQKIKIEVKASRAVDSDSNEPLYVKALPSGSKKRFDMNFQQVKPRYCDVFVWVAVWRDRIRYWVLASKEVENNRYYSTGQHRGNVGEGQLHINQNNIDDLKKYEVAANELYDKILDAYTRQQDGERQRG